MIPTINQLGSVSRSLLAVSAALFPINQAAAAAKIIFTDGNPLDGKGPGASIAAKDFTSKISFKLTTVDILGQDGTYASSGTAHLTESHPSAVGDALGVASFNDPGTWPDEEKSFNPGEAWIFSFDVDVNLDALDFSGWTAASSEVTLSFSDGSPDQVLFGSKTDDRFTFTNLTIPAGTQVTLALTNTTGDQEVSLEYLSVSALLPTPPPFTGLIYDQGDGVGEWTTTTADFLNEDDIETIFQNGDNAIFNKRGNLAVPIQAQGVTAGTVTWDPPSNGTLKFLNGDLTAQELTITGGRGSIAIQNTTVSTKASIYDDGRLKVFTGGDLTLDHLFLSGDALLQIDEGGTYTGGTTEIGGGGARIRNNVDLELGPVTNTYFNNPLLIEKEGTGMLTFTSGLGTQDTGPVDLEIEGGIVTLTGTQQINLGSDIVVDGDLILAGPALELHASIISGEGSLIVQAPSLISPRDQAGPTEIHIPIIFNSKLRMDSAAGDNDLTIRNNMSGPGSMTKQGDGLVVFDQLFTEGPPTSYEGDTTVEEGTLRMWDPLLSATSFVSIEAGGRLDLSHGRQNTVEALYLDGVQMPAGTYGSSSVTSVLLDVVDDNHFLESGYLIVRKGPDPDDYASWASSYSLSGDMDADDDGDGVSNGDEYAFGLDPTNSASLNPISTALDPAAGSFSYTRRNPESYSTGRTYIYEYSLTLDGEWTNFTAAATEQSDGGAPVETVTVAIPAELLSNNRLFVRVVSR